MDILGAQMWKWVLLVILGWMYLDQAVAGPYYMVAIPAILRSGSEVKFCAKLLQPNESLAMTVTLMTENVNTTLFQKHSRQEFHTCQSFMAPIVPEDEVQHLLVEVTGHTFHSREVRKVLNQVNKPVTFIQTDKPIYLPGQTVHFRVVTLDIKLRLACRKYDIIELEDPDGNRIGQWLKHTSEVKILELSFSLSSEAKEGTYQITISSGEDRIYHTFKVEKYVLPKFEVKITSDDQVIIAQQQISVTVCATYTFGQPVPGILKIDVCRPIDRYLFRPPVIRPVVHNQDALPEVTAPCYKESKQINSGGCATFTFPMSTFTQIDQKVLQDTLEIIAKMEEEGTGITHAQNKRVSISYTIGKLSFFDTPNVYEKDSVVEGKVKAVRYDETPLAGMNLHLYEGERWSSRLLQNLTTDNNGVATFSLSTSGYSGEIRLHISDKLELEYPPYREPHFTTGEITLSMVQSPSLDSKTFSSLEVKTTDRILSCGCEEDIFIHYTLVREARGPMDIYFMVIDNNDIITEGLEKIVITDDTVTEGSISFKLQITPAMVPDFAVVTYAILPSSHVIAQKAIFNTEKCFSHKVGIEFDPDRGVPGEEATLRVSGHPYSLCGIGVIDQSVLIQEPGKQLTADKIYDLLPRNRYVPYQVQDPTKCLPVRPKRSIIPFPENMEDAFSVFQSVGLKIATNLRIRAPDCLTYLGREYHYGRHFVAYDRVQENVAMAAPGPQMGGAGFGGAPLSPIETVRTFFPETWLFKLVETGLSGVVDISVQIPDTITTWETEAFCVSSEGFGLAPRKEFTVFQPFFLELSLPYSIVRGETFELKASVFNYLQSCIMVIVTPAPSNDYTLTPATDHSFCLCGNERKTVSWDMSPSALGSVDVKVSAEAVSSQLSCNNEIVQVPARGRIDTVTKQLIVLAEGIEVIKAHNLLLCPRKEMPTMTEEVQIQLPNNRIVGSARAMVSVIGNILGRVMKNLDNLLRMPYGCGEQNMVLFAPNIYILDYLTSSNQLTPEIEEKAKRFLTNGYQRQLNYKHSDGAYSAFGTGPGNTWLTAFVVRCYVRASKYVFIDPAMIQESRVWLESKQMPNGCFEKVGNLFHNKMKGGVSDEVTLSAYISAAFLEMGVPVNNSILAKSLDCLRSSQDVLRNTYTTALMSYVFTLANDITYRTLYLNHLNSVAHHDGGLIYWSQTSAETSASLDVEIGSYVILALLGLPNPTPEEQGYAAQIVRWLVKQQNYYGGFSSTQNTVVALQALTHYSTVVNSPGGQSTVAVRSSNGAELEFQVDQNNQLLYQERSLTAASGNYIVEVKGSACAVIQITVIYNIPIPIGASSFVLTVSAQTNCALRRPRTTLNIEARYTGEEEASNMVVIDIKILSGHSVDTDSLNELKTATSVKRVEKKGDNVLVYLEEAKKLERLSYELVVIRDIIVYGLQPAVIQIYDYYQPDDKVEAEYSSSCMN